MEGMRYGVTVRGDGERRFRHDTRAVKGQWCDGADLFSTDTPPCVGNRWWAAVARHRRGDAKHLPRLMSFTLPPVPRVHPISVFLGRQEVRLLGLDSVSLVRDLKEIRAPRLTRSPAARGSAPRIPPPAPTACSGACTPCSNFVSVSRCSTNTSIVPNSIVISSKLRRLCTSFRCHSSSTTIPCQQSVPASRLADASSPPPLLPQDCSRHPPPPTPPFSPVPSPPHRHVVLPSHVLLHSSKNLFHPPQLVHPVRLPLGEAVDLLVDGREHGGVVGDGPHQLRLHVVQRHPQTLRDGGVRSRIGLYRLQQLRERERGSGGSWESTRPRRSSTSRTYLPSSALDVPHAKCSCLDRLTSRSRKKKLC